MIAVTHHDKQKQVEVKRSSRANQHEIRLFSGCPYYFTLPMYGNYHFFPKQLWQPCKKCRSLSMNVHYIIFSKCTVKSCKKRRTHSCKPFFLDSRNIFLTDSFIFCFIVILCTTHMMAGTVITGDCTATFFFPYYTDPSLFSTVITVLNRIFISSPKVQLLIYSVSSLTTSSKSVISLLPLTCHIPVIPGLMAILAL